MNYLLCGVVELFVDVLVFVWLLSVLVTVLVVTGRSSMLTFRSLNKTDDKLMVVERVKSVFTKTRTNDDSTNKQDFDIKRIIKLFQHDIKRDKKCVTFSDVDEIIKVEGYCDVNKGKKYLCFVNKVSCSSC